MNTIEAKYFDGQSSKTQNVTVTYFNTLTELRFQTENGSVLVWRLADLSFDQYDNITEIRYKKYTEAVLRIEDKLFAQQFYKAMKENKRVDTHTRLLNLGIFKIAAIAVGLFAFVIWSYFYILPPLAEKSAAMLPESVDNEIGDIFIESYMADATIDHEKTAKLNDFAKQLKLNNTKPLKFTVVKSDEVNAFAAPNGQIVVYTGILKDINTPEELAALLGHEASHVNQRHSTKMLCRNLAGYMVVSLLFSDVNGIMAVLAENAQQLHALSYSRGFEQEADEQGLTILMNNHLNPKGMVELFNHLERESKGSVPAILSSHPLTKDRKENMQKLIAEKKYVIQSNPQLAEIFELIKQ